MLSEKYLISYQKMICLVLSQGTTFSKFLCFLLLLSYSKMIQLQYEDFLIHLTLKKEIINLKFYQESKHCIRISNFFLKNLKLFDYSNMASLQSDSLSLIPLFSNKLKISLSGNV